MAPRTKKLKHTAAEVRSHTIPGNRGYSTPRSSKNRRDGRHRHLDVGWLNEGY